MSKLSIGIDVHSIGSKKGGNETYYRELVRGLASTPSDHQFVLYHTKSEARKWLPIGKGFRTQRIKLAHPVLRIPFALPWRARKDDLDIYHAQYIVPPFLRCKTVVSIFDLAHERFPEFFDPLEARRSQHLVRWSAQRADRIVTVSHFSARDLERIYGVNPEKITVTYLAAGEEFQPINKSICRDLLARKYGLDSAFILYAGRLQARKNLPRLVEAYAQSLRKGIEEKLVIVGKRDWQADELFETVRRFGLESDVKFLGYVPGEDLPYLYNAASAFVFPSIFEGFGLPVLESMACGTPTITSLGSSLEEVAGDAALLVDPYSVESIADALFRILDDSNLRQQLCERGLRRAAQFSYQAAAEQTIKVYENI